MVLPVTSLIASINALIFTGLALNVIRLRRRHGISLGEGGREDLQRAIRAFGNLSEYLPLVLGLLALVEANEANSLVLYAGGFIFTLSRVGHAAVFLGVAGKYSMILRVAGMMVTFFSIISCAIFLMVKFLI